MSKISPIGLYISFDPQFNLEGDLKQFKVYLHSRLPADVTIGYAWMLDGEVRYETLADVPRQSDLFLHTVYLDELNDSPVMDVEIELKASFPGKESLFECDHRIRPKGFFSRLQENPFFNHPVYLFEVVPNLPDIHHIDPKPLQSHFSRIRQSQHSSSPIEERANFKHEIDLHADKLVKDTSRLTPAEVLPMQLKAFEQFLNRAIVHGQHRVFIIHGVGTGKLRQAIWDRLDEYPQVKSYKNEYHGQYGFGATEVELG